MIDIKDGYIGAMSDGSYVRFMLDANGVVYYYYIRLQALSDTHDENGKSISSDIPDIVAIFGYPSNMEEYYGKRPLMFSLVNRDNIGNRVPLWHRPATNVKVLASELLEQYKTDTLEIIQDEEDVIWIKKQ